MRAATEDDREDIRGRLVALGFPLGATLADQVAWCRQLVNDGTLERSAITEELMRGAAIDAIAHACGISSLRVYHHLGRPAGWSSDERNPWRIVLEEEDFGEAA